MARPAGLEPAAYGFEVRRSIQLSYGRSKQGTPQGGPVNTDKTKFHHIICGDHAFPRRRSMIVRVLAAGLVLALAAPAYAQGNAAPAPAPSPQAPQDPDRPPTFEDQVVVSASRSEQQVV